MRRALLTARTPGTPVSVGNTGLFGTANHWPHIDSRTLIDYDGPATATSTVTTVQTRVVASGTFYVFTGSISGSTFTVRDVTPGLTLSTGLQTLSVALDVNAGDYIGIMSPTGTIAIRLSSGANSRYVPGTTPPTKGATLSMSNIVGARISLLGTNP